MKWKFSMVLFFCFLLSFCTTTYVFDKDLPPEQSAKLIIGPALTIKTYNGISVELKSGMGYIEFTIPAGKTELTYDISSIVISRNIPLTYNFEAGNKYTLMSVFIDKEENVLMTSLGAASIAIVLLQGNDTKKPLLVITDFGQNEKLILK